jgi:O-antigen/teichoic acid export membrane protein
VRELKHKILLALIAATVIGELGSIFLWATNRPVAGEPYARFSLAVDYRVAVADAVVFAALNILAFIWVQRKNKIGVPFLITISIINRVLSSLLFIGGAHAILITWTALLIIFSYNEYRGLSNFEVAFLSAGSVASLAISGVLFSAMTSASVGFVFYLAVLAVLVTIVAALRKLRKK